LLTSGIYDIIDGWKKSQIMFSATRLGIFETLRKKHTDALTARQIAERLQLNDFATERLLNYCVWLKLLDKTVNAEEKVVYRNTDCAEKFLIRSSPTSVVPLIKYRVAYWNVANHLVDAVKTGKPQLCPTTDSSGDPTNLFTGTDGLYSDHDRKIEFLEFMDVITKNDSTTVIKAFDLKKYGTACDLGGGTGYLAATLAEFYTDMQVMVVELDDVVEVMDHFLPNPIPENLTVMKCDIFKDKLPCVDLFILASIIHDWDEKRIDSLLGRIYEALNPGGAVLLIERTFNESKDGPDSPVLADLEMLLYCTGCERTATEYKQLLAKHGFTGFEIQLHNQAFRNAMLAHKLDKST